jgi:hypothetical protein
MAPDIPDVRAVFDCPGRSTPQKIFDFFAPPPRKPRPVLTLAGLPPACKQIVKAP